VVYMKVFTPAPLRTWMAAGAAGMAWLGIYLLWDDFIRPLVRRDSGPSS